MNKDTIAQAIDDLSLGAKRGGVFSVLGMSRIAIAGGRWITYMGNRCVITSPGADVPDCETEFFALEGFVSQLHDSELSMTHSDSTMRVICGSTKLELPMFTGDDCKLQSVITDMDDIIKTEASSSTFITPEDLGHLMSLIPWMDKPELCNVEIRGNQLYAIHANRRLRKTMHGDYGEVSIPTGDIAAIGQFAKGETVGLQMEKRGEYLVFKRSDSSTLFIVRSAETYADMDDVLSGFKDVDSWEWNPANVIDFSETLNSALSRAGSICDKKKGDQKFILASTSESVTIEYKSSGGRVVDTIMREAPTTGADFRIQTTLQQLSVLSLDGLWNSIRINPEESMIIIVGSEFTATSRYNNRAVA
jgi:hypothetical protein